MTACEKCYKRGSHCRGRKQGKLYSKTGLTFWFQGHVGVCQAEQAGRGNSNTKGPKVKKHQRKVWRFQRLGTEAWLIAGMGKERVVESFGRLLN